MDALLAGSGYYCNCNKSERKRMRERQKEGKRKRERAFGRQEVLQRILARKTIAHMVGTVIAQV